MLKRLWQGSTPLTATGLLWPLGPVAIVAAMLMAITVHWPKFWAQDGGIELPLLLLTASLGLALAGPGAYALDRALSLQLPEPLALIVGLIAAVVGVGLALATRAPVPASEQIPATAH